MDFVRGSGRSGLLTFESEVSFHFFHVLSNWKLLQRCRAHLTLFGEMSRSQSAQQCNSTSNLIICTGRRVAEKIFDFLEYWATVAATHERDGRLFAGSNRVPRDDVVIIQSCMVYPGRQVNFAFEFRETKDGRFCE